MALTGVRDGAGAGPHTELNGAGLIGRRLRAVRHARYLRARDLAALLGASPSYVSNVEQGRRSVSLEKLWQWCALLEVDLGDVVRRPVGDIGSDEPEAFVLERLRPGIAHPGDALVLAPLSAAARDAWVEAERTRVLRREERRRDREAEAAARRRTSTPPKQEGADAERTRVARESEERRTIVEATRRRFDREAGRK